MFVAALNELPKILLRGSPAGVVDFWVRYDGGSYLGVVEGAWEKSELLPAPLRAGVVGEWKLTGTRKGFAILHKLLVDTRSVLHHQ